MSRTNPLLASLLVACILVAPSSACRPLEPITPHQVRSDLGVAFASASAALEVLQALHNLRVAQAAAGDPTPEQLEWLALQGARLERLREQLDIVRDWVEGQAEESDGRAAFRIASNLLQLLVDDLEKQGVPTPPVVKAGLLASQLYL